MTEKRSEDTGLNGKQGRQLIEDPLLNRGTAFTEAQRREYGLQGLLPPHVETLEMQVARAYEAFQGRAKRLVLQMQNRICSRHLNWHGKRTLGARLFSGEVPTVRRWRCGLQVSNRNWSMEFWHSPLESISSDSENRMIGLRAQPKKLRLQHLSPLRRTKHPSGKAFMMRSQATRRQNSYGKPKAIMAPAPCGKSLMTTASIGNPLKVFWGNSNRAIQIWKGPFGQVDIPGWPFSWELRCLLPGSFQKSGCRQRAVVLVVSPPRRYI